MRTAKCPCTNPKVAGTLRVPWPTGAARGAYLRVMSALISRTCQSTISALLLTLACMVFPSWQATSLAAEPQESNTWVKCSPVEGGPPSPGLGYEASLAYDPLARRVIRWAGHNQGGGGE